MKQSTVISCVLIVLFLFTIFQNSSFGQTNSLITRIDSIKTKDKTKYKPKISEFIQFQTLNHFDSNNDGEVLPWRYRGQRVRLRVEGKISDKIGYQVEIDPRAPEITGILRDAYISFNYLPKHKILLGQQKTQFGYENRISSTSLYFVNRTDVSDNLSRGVNLRDIGIGLTGFIPINKSLRFEDAITLVNGAGMNVQYDNSDKKNLWGRIGLRYKTDNIMGRIGVSGGYGDLFEPADTAANTPAYFIDFKRFGVDVQLEHKWFTLASEYVMGWDKDIEGESIILGYYLLLTGNTPWKIGPEARYENLDDEFIRWTFGAYYGKPNDKLRVLINYEIRKVMDDPEFPNGEDNRLYLWLQVKL